MYTRDNIRHARLSWHLYQRMRISGFLRVIRLRIIRLRVYIVALADTSPWRYMTPADTAFCGYNAP